MAEEPKLAQVSIKLREGEYELLLRLRQIRNQAGDQRIRLELELSKDQISIENQYLLKREAFTLG